MMSLRSWFRKTANDDKLAAARQRKPSERPPSYLETLIAEIRILVRAVANNPERRLSDLNVEWTDEAGTKKNYRYPDIVLKIAEATKLANQPAPAVQGQPPMPAGERESEDSVKLLGLLQAVKDGLVAYTKPATGLTVAYTALVIGARRDTAAFSTHDLAEKAYGGLAKQARSHARRIRVLSWIAIILSCFAAWEASKAALGKSLLQVLDPLRAQQSAIAAEMVRLDNQLFQAPAGQQNANGAANAGQYAPAVLLPVCRRSALVSLSDREWAQLAAFKQSTPEALTKELGKERLYRTPQERDLCERDSNLAHNFEIAHGNLARFQCFWPDMAGGIYSVLGHIGATVKSLPLFIRRLFTGADTPATAAPRVFTTANFCDAASGPNHAAQDAGSKTVITDDIEFNVAPIIQTITTFILPFVFGIVGSLLYVLLSHYTSIKDNTLSPRDRALTSLRLILGVVVAACVSLLITSYAGPNPPAQIAPSGAPSASTLVSSLTLSASAITFLAGFGAEAVFTLLQNLVARVFVTSNGTSAN